MSSKTVLITGISGFVATSVALVFLENGWTVRGTVRSEEKGKQVAALSVFQKYSDKLQFAVVKDVAHGDFTEALKGVDAVAHTASPFNLTGKSWVDDYKTPAVEGTINVLEAAAKVPSIKNVVVTSSFAAIGNFNIPATEQAGKVYTEEDWNPVTNEDCEGITSDNEMSGAIWYLASKKFAELAAVDIAKRANFTLGTVLPPMVYGPPLQAIDNLDNLNTSTAGVYGLMKKDGSSVDGGIPSTEFPIFADVRDLAEAHYQIIAQGKSGRYAITSGIFSNQEMADVIREKYPQLRSRVPVGNPGERLQGKVFTLSAAKAEKELGIKFTPFEKTITDTVDALLAIEKSLA